MRVSRGPRGVRILSARKFQPLSRICLKTKRFEAVPSSRFSAQMTCCIRFRNIMSINAVVVVLAAVRIRITYECTYMYTYGETSILLDVPCKSGKKKVGKM